MTLCSSDARAHTHTSWCGDGASRVDSRSESRVSAISIQKETRGLDVPGELEELDS